MARALLIPLLMAWPLVEELFCGFSKVKDGGNRSVDAAGSAPRLLRLLRLPPMQGQVMSYYMYIQSILC